MCTIAEMNGRVNELATKLGIIAVNVLDDMKSEVVNLQREQMMDGRNKLGEEIGTYRSIVYADMKHRMNPRPGNGVPDLRLTGAFHDGIKLETSPASKTYVITSTDPKTNALIKKYGSKIFGLDSRSREILIGQLGYKKNLVSAINFALQI